MGVEIVTVSCDTKFSHLAWHTVEKVGKVQRGLLHQAIVAVEE